MTLEEQIKELERELRVANLDASDWRIKCRKMRSVLVNVKTVVDGVSNRGTPGKVTKRYAAIMRLRELLDAWEREEQGDVSSG